MTKSVVTQASTVFVIAKNLIVKNNFLSSILVPSLLFLPLVFAKFGRLDDFVFYLYTRSDVSGVIHSGLTYGRPITSLILGKTFSSVSYIQDFSKLRLLSLACLILVFLFAGRFYSKMGAARFTFGLLLFMTLPGLWVFLSWAQGLPHIVALLFLIVGASCYFKAKLKWLFFLLSALTMFTYQPFALLFPIVLMSRIIQNRDDRYKKHFFIIMTWTIILAIINFWLVKSQASPNVRSNITENYTEKLHWFVSEWVPRVTFPWSLNANTTMSTISIILFALLAASYIFKERNLKAPILFSCMIFPGIPFIISVENWASSRAVFASNIAFLIVALIFSTSLRLNYIFSIITNLVATSSLAYLLFIATMNGYQGLVFPQAQEWARLEQEIRLVGDDATLISGQVSLFEQSGSPIFSYDEYGVLNSSVETALLGMITMAKFETAAESIPIEIGADRICQMEFSHFLPSTNTYILLPIAGTPGCTG